MTQRRTVGRPTGRLLAAVMLAGPLIPVSSMAAADTATSSFVATSEASGFVAQYTVPGFVAVERFIDGGGPVSRAYLGSDGTARSFSSLPDPGETFRGYPGLANLVFGVAPPGYPLYVSASYPTQPEQSLSDPTRAYALNAKATAAHALGEAQVGLPGGTPNAKSMTQARSEVVAEGGRVSATAVSLTQGFALGPLSIGMVWSQSVTTYHDGDPQPITSTQLAVEGGRVNDLAFSFGRDGLQVANQSIRLPGADGLAALNQALASAGMAVALGEAAPIGGGATAAALEIRSVREVPGVGTGTLRVRLGGVTSSIFLEGTQAAPPGVDAPPSEGSSASTILAPEAEAGGVTSAAAFPSGVVLSSDRPDQFPLASLHESARVSSDGVVGANLNVDAAPAWGAVVVPPLPVAHDAEMAVVANPVAQTALPRDLRATSAVAGLLLAGVVLMLGLLGGWRWTKREASSWTP